MRFSLSQLFVANQFLKTAFLRLLLAFVSTVVISSCSVQKRYSMPGYSVQWHVGGKKLNTKVSSPDDEKTRPNVRVSRASVNDVEALTVEKPSLLTASSLDKPFEVYSTAKAHSPVSQSYSHVACDTLVDKDNAKLVVQIIEITPKEIKYKKCDNLDRPTISVYKSDFKLIQYANGTADTLSAFKDNSPVYYPPRTKQAEPNIMAVLSLAFGGGGFFVIFLAPLAAILAIIFGVVGLAQIKANPDKYTGSGFAIAGIACGVLILLVTGVIIAAALGAFEG